MELFLNKLSFFSKNNQRALSRISYDVKSPFSAYKLCVIAEITYSEKKLKFFWIRLLVFCIKISWGLIARASDINYLIVKIQICHSHLVFCYCACFVRAYYCYCTKAFSCRKLSYQHVLSCKPSCAQRETDCDY